MSSILVTGAAGFIGSHLCEKLISEGHHVVGIDNFDPFYSKKVKDNNLKNLNESNNFKFEEGDLLSTDFLKKVFVENKFSLVIHLAAKAGVRPSLSNPTNYVKTNVEATNNLLEAMRNHKLFKFIFASSSSVYGNSEQVPFLEGFSFSNAISPYAFTKQSGELLTRLYHNLYGFDVINLRFFTVYGPRQRPDLAIYKFLKASLTNEPITLYGDGSMARDYTYISDTISGIMGSVKRIFAENKIYEVYNLGNSSPVTLKVLVEAIEKISNKKLIIHYESVPQGDVPSTYADIQLANRYLDYKPEVSLDTGLRFFYDWMISQN